MAEKINHVEISPERDVCLHVKANNSSSKIQLSLKTSRKVDKNTSMLVDKGKLVVHGQYAAEIELLRKELETKEWLLAHITADRDKVKSKLTETVNRNIELDLKLSKYKRMLKKSHHVCLDKSTFTTATSCPPYVDLDLLKTRCKELEAINMHLSEHLTKVKIAFDELNLSTSDASASAVSRSPQIIAFPKESSETVSTEVTVTISDESSQFDKWYHA